MKYVAVDEMALLADLRRDIFSHLPLLVEKWAATRFDILVIPAFLEYIYLIRFTLFTLRDRLLVPICNLHTFELIRE